jgi:hypothetical protein
VAAQGEHFEMKSRAVVLLLIAIAATALASCEKGMRYPVKVAPVSPVYPAFMDRSVYWIDDDTVLYTGVYGDIRSTPPPPHKLVAWNVRDNSVREIGDISSRYGHICFADGYVRFVTAIDGDDLILKEGPLNALSTRRIRQDEFGDDAARKRGEVPTPFSCHYPKRADVGPRADCLIPLREGDGFLDYTGGNCKEGTRERRREIAKAPDWQMSRLHLELDTELRAQPVVYLPATSGPEIQLPIKAGEVGARVINHVSWGNAYVIKADDAVSRVMGAWPKGEPHPIYLLSQGGVIKRIDMPYTEWNRGDVAAALYTQVGMLVISHRVGRNGEVGDAGIYRIIDNKLESILPAYVLAIAVSPNGCDVSIVIQDLKSLAFRMNVHDVCAGRT